MLCGPHEQLNLAGNLRQLRRDFRVWLTRFSLFNSLILCLIQFLIHWFLSEISASQRRRLRAILIWLQLESQGFCLVPPR